MKETLINWINLQILNAAEKADMAETKYKGDIWNTDFIFSKFQEYLGEQMFYVWLKGTLDTVDDICQNINYYINYQMDHLISVRMNGPKNNRADMVLMYEVKREVVAKKAGFLLELIRLFDVKLPSEAMTKLQLLRR